MNYDDDWGYDDTLERRQWESRTLRDILIERCARKIQLLKELKNARKNSRQELSDRR